MVLTRRDFLLAGTAAGAIVGGAVLVPIGFVLSDDYGGSGATAARLATFPRARVASFADLQIGEPVWFDYPFEGASNLLVRTGEPVLAGIGPDRDLVSYSNQCTHMGCPITEYRPDEHVLGPCPCHYSSFDLSRDGIATFGQATQNLPRVLLEIDGDDVYAMGVFRLIFGHDDNLAGEDLVTVGEEMGA
ncbi:MAG: arsenate reductase (azurin) small subunit [Acidimicrobiia bacterium]|nr:arsenate reductase (azurin) small subunit [Acidimicrobiia bacterium]